MATLTRLLLPLALLVAVFILLRGHNQPGGGFIAGLITAVALIVQYLANGAQWTHQRMSSDSRPLIACGARDRRLHRAGELGCSATPSSPRPSAICTGPWSANSNWPRRWRSTSASSSSSSAPRC